ncbi:hypothetical protein ACP70R_030159 [Stipagrostis hirtigluma subsp. patula]
MAYPAAALKMAAICILALCVGSQLMMAAVVHARTAPVSSSQLDADADVVLLQKPLVQELAEDLAAGGLLGCSTWDCRKCMTACMASGATPSACRKRCR